MTQQATDRGDAATGPGVRRDIMVMTLALTFDNTCPGKEIQGRVFEAEGKVNLKPGGVKQPARSRNLTQSTERLLKRRPRQEEASGVTRGRSVMRITSEDFPI